MQEKFGRIANVMKTDKSHEIPPLEPSNYNPPGDHGLSENVIMAIQVDQTKSRMRRVRDLEQHPQFYAALLQGVSAESYDLIERHPDFAANDLVQDPNVLWRIIKETNSTNITGGESCRSCPTKSQCVPTSTATTARARHPSSSSRRPSSTVERPSLPMERRKCQRRSSL